MFEVYIGHQAGPTLVEYPCMIFLSSKVHIWLSIHTILHITADLITSVVKQFDTKYDSERQQLFILISDGNPCGPDSLGGCPQSVCSYSNQIRSAGIHTAVVAVGKSIDKQYVGCIAEDWFSAKNYAELDAFDDGTFDALLCPNESLSNVVGSNVDS